MDTYLLNMHRNQTDDPEFWQNLLQNEESEDILSVTHSEITDAVKSGYLTIAQMNALNKRKTDRIASIRQESVRRYPVQVPEQTAQQTFSDKFSEKMSESKRKKKLNKEGTVLHQKKLNALDVENAESKHQNEKNVRLAKVMRSIQTRYSDFLRGQSVNDFLSRPGISDLAEFLLEDNEQNIVKNMDVLTGVRSSGVLEPPAVRECVRQFLALDLTADLRTDKALAKDADRMEKILGKTKAMIRLVDQHPEIEEEMTLREREEFEGKLDRAYALSEYYQMRKDIVTDGWYRTHENSEISMRFEQMPANLARQLEKERKAGAGQQNGDQPTKAEQRAQQYYRCQNLTRKIWDAEQLASTMDKYIRRDVENSRFYIPLRENINQEDTSRRTAAAWQNYAKDKLASPGDLTKPPLDTTSEKGKYLAEHKDDEDIYDGVTKNHTIAGTNDHVPELSREYGFASWYGIKTLSDTEFTDMMQNLAAFSLEVNEYMDSSEIQRLRNRQLNALRTYKEILVRETGFLKEKYGCGLRLENPFSVRDHYTELWQDLGNTQTQTLMFGLFKKYGIIDENNPDDLDMEATILNLHNSFTSAMAVILEWSARTDSEKESMPSYADTMRRYTLKNQELLAGFDIDKTVVMRIKEQERELGANTQVKWGLKPPYANA